MAEIEVITRYRFNGQEFKSLPDVAKFVENQIGNIIDSTPLRLNRRDALQVFDALVKNRKQLIMLLSAEFIIDDELQASEKSIFDL